MSDRDLVAERELPRPVRDGQPQPAGGRDESAAPPPAAVPPAIAAPPAIGRAPGGPAAAGESNAEGAEPSVPLNREQRRARRFRKRAAASRDSARLRGTDPAPSESGASPPAYEAGEGETVLRGPGTGGATESDGRLVHHEGEHLGNRPNS